jgi:hypothetical protein
MSHFITTNKKHKFVFLIALLLLTGCRQKYLWFTELQGAHGAENDHVLRVYFDRYGDVYPQKSIYIHPDEFLPGRPDDKLNHARLETYFTGNSAYLDEALAAYGLPSTNNPKADYDHLQLKIMNEYRLKLQQFSQQQTIQNLVVLVHGFNDPNPTGTYQELRDFIRSEHFDEHHEFAYLEVYWDGLTANGGSPGYAKIWGKAQFNSRYVCLGLRKLLNQMDIPKTIPMTIITHSLGASVATGALFNTHSKWNDDINSFTSKEIKQLEEEKTPIMPVRLGMLASAIPGVSTFTDILQKSPTITPDKENINRIVVSINPGDYALDKGTFRKSQFLAARAGATTLGSDYDGEAEKVRNCLKNIYGHAISNEQYRVIPFTTKPMPNPNEKFNEHGLHYYLKDKPAMHLFIQSLFAK